MISAGGWRRSSPDTVNTCRKLCLPARPYSPEPLLHPMSRRCVPLDEMAGTDRSLGRNSQVEPPDRRPFCSASREFRLRCPSAVGAELHPEAVRHSHCFVQAWVSAPNSATTRVKKRDGHRKAFESRRSIAQDVLTMVPLRWIAVAAVLLLIAALAAAEHRRANDTGDRAHSAQRGERNDLDRSSSSPSCTDQARSPTGRRGADVPGGYRARARRTSAGSRRQVRTSAQVLNINLTTLWRKRKRWGLD
jgi:hypothetical protein